MKNSSTLVVVGHRGAKGLALENTAPSIEAAIRYGIDMVEIDLRLSKDGRLVLLHDEHAVARNGEIVRPQDFTYKQLLTYFPDLLTLDDLLPLVNHRCNIMLECKVYNAVAPTVQLLQQEFAKKSGWRAEEFLFASFDFKTLKDFQSAIPDIPVVVLERWSSVRAVLRARKLRTEYLSMDQRFLWSGVIKNLSKKYKLFCYPSYKLTHVNHAKPGKWSRYGLYGVITDFPNFYLLPKKK